MEKKNNENNLDEWNERLQVENEILKLKLMAERGACFIESSEDLPREVEAEFLKNVQLFEDLFDKAEEVTIYEYIGKPEFKGANELTDADLKDETQRLLGLMQLKNIVLDVMGEYEPPVIYKFITEELFSEKIREINIPGYFHHFIYEEFHPNHDIDISKTAQKFIDHWFGKGFNEANFELSDQLVTGDRKIFSKEEVLVKLQNCLSSYQRFTNIKIKAIDTSFEWDQNGEKGFGHAEGMLRYDAEIGNGEIIHFGGPFKLYMINEYAYWQIFYFEFPGFAW